MVKEVNQVVLVVDKVVQVQQMKVLQQTQVQVLMVQVVVFQLLRIAINLGTT